MVSDFENMQCVEDFVQVTPIKRKRKAPPIEQPKKKKLKRKLDLKPPPTPAALVIGKDA